MNRSDLIKAREQLDEKTAELKQLDRSLQREAARVASLDGVRYTDPDGRTVSSKEVAESFKELVLSVPAAVVAFAFSVAKREADRNEDPETGQTHVRMRLFVEVLNMVESSIEALAVEVFKAMGEDEKAALVKLVVDRLRKLASVEQATEQGRRAIQNVIRVLVDRELEAMQDVLIHRISELVAARWEQEVESIVRKRVDDAIAKIKAEVVR